MGQEIKSADFTQGDIDIFTSKLRHETHLLEQAFSAQKFAYGRNIVGFEIEACLVSQAGIPIPVNHTFLEKLNNLMVVHELAAFNVELNSAPIQLEGHALTKMEIDLQQTWDTCRQAAHSLSIDMMMIGILPSIQDRHLSMENMSRLNRYKALNDQLIKHRQGQPLQLDIKGRDNVQTFHRDVMLESACTSLQLHLQIPPDKAANFMNLSMLVSGPVVAVSANSPYLFGRDLWDETRIPLFEQAVAVGRDNYRRVTFGSGYIKSSIMEFYQENLEHYPVLMPINEDITPTFFNHLRFHNGTIWRWNRPLIGFDNDNKPHLRIEHRVIPSGPTIIDSIANAAFYFGLINGLEGKVEELVEQIDFGQARENFYQCAQYGLAANVCWGQSEKLPLKQVLLEVLIPAASQGLSKINIDGNEIKKYMGIIETRIRGGQNGANWQRRWVAKYGRDMQRLTRSYMQKQQQGIPVHEWSI